jgi:hypothetical protein
VCAKKVDSVIRGSVVVDVKVEGMHIVAFLRGVSGIVVSVCINGGVIRGGASCIACCGVESNGIMSLLPKTAL